MMQSLLSLPKQVSDLLTRLSATWAAKLDTLHDTRLTATWASKLDALRTGMTDARMGYLDRLDTTIGSRAAASSQMTGIVKSIEHGTVSIANGVTSGSATLSQSVTVSRSVLIPLGVSGAPASFLDFGYRLSLSSTTVTATRYGTGNGLTAGFVVVEFY